MIGASATQAPASALTQLHQGTVTQILFMQTTSSANLLLRHGTALIELIRMLFNLGMHSLLPEYIVSVVVCPGEKFGSGPLSPLQHIA